MQKVTRRELNNLAFECPVLKMHLELHDSQPVDSAEYTLLQAMMNAVAQLAEENIRLRQR